ncbi:transcriptional Coactivator p15-domain-containing protein [Ochromonadaceae sp. CCMP2298]|nr:transcriptional Coactivator p15-domain-containing protein [Ochromonadaceae sp. CCMP2298]
MSSEKKRASDGEVATEEGKKAKKGEAVEKVYDLGGDKKARVSSYKGRVYIDIREYYIDKSSGKEMPGKKGITLGAEQWEAFKEVIPDLDVDLKGSNA